MALLIATLLVASSEIVVAVNGNDAAAGSSKAPVRSIQRAIELARIRHSKRIVVRAGEYEIRKAISVSQADSGLTIETEKGARPLLSGASRIPSSAVTPVDDPAILSRLLDATARPLVKSIDLSKFITGPIAPATAYGFGRPIVPTPNELFADETPYIPARWPNEGYAKIQDVLAPGNGEDDQNAPPRKPKFIATVDRAKLWAKAKDVWFYGYWKYDWADESILASAIDPATGAITLSHPHQFGIVKNAPFFAENLIEELDRPGESYVDRDAKRLYFIPRPGTRLMRLSVLTEPFFDIQKATGVTIRGFDLAYSRGDGVRIAEGRQNRVEGCQFYDLGMRGAVIDGGYRNGLSGCNIWNVGEGGVSLSGGDRNKLIASENYVENCDIHHFQRRSQTYRPAVSINGVGNRVAHCAMHDAPHSAIIFGGNEHVIEFNEFYRTVNRTGDGGVVYTGRDWTARGTQVRYNHFHDNIGIRQWEPAIYFDDLASGLVAKGNLIERCHWGFLVGGGQDHVIEDNVIVDCALGLQCDARGLGWYANNKPIMVERLNAVPFKTEPWRSRYPQLLTIMEDSPMAPRGNLLQNNLLLRSGKLLDRTEDGFKRTTRYVGNREQTSKGDWRGLAGAPKLPIAKMGLVRDAIRATLPARRP